MKWRLINTELQYQKALKRLEVIFNSRKSTKQGYELELLSLLIDMFEKEK